MKRLTKTTVAITTAITVSFFITNTAHAKCGDITIAQMNWASAQLMANVDKIICKMAMAAMPRLCLVTPCQPSRP